MHVESLVVSKNGTKRIVAFWYFLSFFFTLKSYSTYNLDPKNRLSLTLILNFNGQDRKIMERAVPRSRQPTESLLLVHAHSTVRFWHAYMAKLSNFIHEWVCSTSKHKTILQKQWNPWLQALYTCVYMGTKCVGIIRECLYTVLCWQYCICVLGYYKKYEPLRWLGCCLSELTCLFVSHSTIQREVFEWCKLSHISNQYKLCEN